MFALAGWVLDGENDNFLGLVVSGVIDQIGIPPRTSFRTPSTFCCRPICGNKTKLCSDSRIAARTWSAACGLCSRI